ncbi:unnamed protein product [Lasius platythorax]|uniref:Uncharacterized protein n=1 Tax=Lasius platythorax TaxID=488582 RepID=A0AAV2P2Z4_9HYME
MSTNPRFVRRSGNNVTQPIRFVYVYLSPGGLQHQNVHHFVTISLNRAVAHHFSRFLAARTFSECVQELILTLIANISGIV